jgi:nucleoid-associated protein YgaU
VSDTSRSEGLTKASIFEVDSSRRSASGGVKVTCMFNPFEYTVTKSNNFAEPQSANAQNAPPAEFSKAGAQTLKLNLLFDTYGTGKDVRTETDKLWKLMEVKDQPGQSKKSPPSVAFCWGTFYFVSYITQMSQKFTLFDRMGVPVRALVDVTFTQYVDERDEPPRGTTADAVAGDAPKDRAWPVVGADRLDNVAADTYGDPSKWREIARHNNIVDPHNVQPGQFLVLPAKPY